MAYINTIQPDDATGELKDIYEEILETRGKIAEVHKIQSLNPITIKQHIDFYLTLMFGKSPLKRYQRELIGVVVSAANDCEYCQDHHSEALFHFWKDEELVKLVRKDYKKASLKPVDVTLCNYAWDLTENPGNIRESQHIHAMKEAGLDDRSILDAALITSYFNFVNRMVLGLGVQLETEGGKGYHYD